MDMPSAIGFAAASGTRIRARSSAWPSKAAIFTALAAGPSRATRPAPWGSSLAGSPPSTSTRGGGAALIGIASPSPPGRPEPAPAAAAVGLEPGRLAALHVHLGRRRRLHRLRVPLHEPQA